MFICRCYFILLLNSKHKLITDVNLGKCTILELYFEDDQANTVVALVI